MNLKKLFKNRIVVEHVIENIKLVDMGCYGIKEGDDVLYVTPYKSLTFKDSDLELISLLKKKYGPNKKWQFIEASNHESQQYRCVVGRIELNGDLYAHSPA